MESTPGRPFGVEFARDGVWVWCWCWRGRGRWSTGSVVDGIPAAGVGAVRWGWEWVVEPEPYCKRRRRSGTHRELSGTLYPSTGAGTRASIPSPSPSPSFPSLATALARALGSVIPSPSALPLGFPLSRTHAYARLARLSRAFTFSYRERSGVLAGNGDARGELTSMFASSAGAGQGQGQGQAGGQGSMGGWQTFL